VRAVTLDLPTLMDLFHEMPTMLHKQVLKLGGDSAAGSGDEDAQWAEDRCLMRMLHCCFHSLRMDERREDLVESRLLSVGARPAWPPSRVSMHVRRMSESYGGFVTRR
jgi:hypothetical protein